MSRESASLRDDQADATALALMSASHASVPNDEVQTPYLIPPLEADDRPGAPFNPFHDIPDPGTMSPATPEEQFYNGSLGETYDVNVSPATQPSPPASTPRASPLPPIITEAQTREDMAKLAAVNNAAAGEILSLIVDGLRDLVERADAIHDIHKLFKSIAIVSLGTGRVELQVDEQPGIHVSPDVMEAAAASLGNINPGRPLRQMDVRPIYEEDLHGNDTPA